MGTLLKTMMTTMNSGRDSSWATTSRPRRCY